MTVLSFGAWVQRSRKMLGMTQMQLAERVGCSHEMIRKIERDLRRPSLQIAELLARALEIPADQQGTFLRSARLERAGVTASPSSNAPLISSALIGRDWLLADLALLLEQHRLITLTGPAGVGKTVLAQALAAQVAFADGIFIVPLAGIERADEVLPTIAAALHLPEQGTQSLHEQLAAFFHNRQVLLVLDNLEHIAFCAPIIQSLLVASPTVKFLTTSRVPLHVRNETVVEVPPLDVVENGSAFQLFVARAREARLDFEVSQHDSQAIAAICRVMDGLPLAIELVAARSNVLDPQPLLERLGGAHGYTLLELPKTNTAPVSRHQTLRNAIGWSFELLLPLQQRLFMWLGVFQGGFTLAAAEAVAASQTLRPIDVLDGLQVLINAHLIVRQRDANNELRFSMLVTIREYALEQLALTGEQASAQRDHAHYYLALIQQQRQQFQGPDQEAAMDVLEREHDNVRVALRWLLEHEIGLAADFGAALWWFWYVRSHWREGLYWLEQLVHALAQHHVDSAVHARVLRGASALAEELVRYEQADTWATQSLALSRATDNKRAMVATLNNLGALRHIRGDSEQARQCFLEALELSRAGDRPIGVGVVLGCLGSLTTDLGEYKAAREYLAESMQIMVQEQYPFGIVSTHLYQADLELAEMQDTVAETLYVLVRDEQRKQYNWKDVALALWGLGWVDYRRKQFQAALAEQQEALQLCQEHGLPQVILLCLEGCAAAAGAFGMIESAQLQAAAQAERERLGTPRHFAQQQAFGPAMAYAASKHPAHLWEAALQLGRSLTPAQALTLALSLNG